MRVVKELKTYWNYICFSARSRLKAEVANSYLNWIWWVLEPFCFMLIYTIIFGYIFDSGEENFPVYIFIGNTIWGFFSRTVSSSVNMIRSNETIIAKVYLPKYILVIVEMMVNAFKMLISFGLTAIMIVIFRINISFRVLWLIPVLATLFLVTFGISVLLMHGGVYIDDLSHVTTIGLSIMMYFTGIFFSIENRLDAPFSTILGIGNPVAFLLTSARKAIMYCQTPDLIILFVWFVISLCISALAIRVIYKNENNYVKIM